MTVQPEPDVAVFELPDPGECDDQEDRIVLDAGHELSIRYRLWKDRLIVEFAIIQVVRHNGTWVDVARIDSCIHGSVHKHQLRKRAPGDNQGRRIELERIPVQNGWTVVDAWYEKALQLMQDDWRDNLRRWRRGSA